MILDAHIHLFDPRRPQGVPWPPTSDALLYQPALPERYKKLAAKHGITGAIAVEASPWLEDNHWLLEIAATDPIIAGVVGNLDPASAEFPKHLARFAKNPKFRGIRYGNLWDRNLAHDLAKPGFLDNLKLLAEADLSLDTANQTPELLAAALKVHDRIPALRIIIDHLPQMEGTADGALLANFQHRPTIYAKLSEILKKGAPKTLSVYREKLDTLRRIFTDDRILWGSDWPNSDQWASFDETVALATSYLPATHPYFRGNAEKAYRLARAS